MGARPSCSGCGTSRPIPVDVIPPRRSGRKIQDIRWHNVLVPTPELRSKSARAFRCTTPSRTLVDMAGLIGQHLAAPPGRAGRRLRGNSTCVRWIASSPEVAGAALRTCAPSSISGARTTNGSPGCAASWRHICLPALRRRRRPVAQSATSSSDIDGERLRRSTCSGRRNALRSKPTARKPTGLEAPSRATDVAISSSSQPAIALPASPGGRPKTNRLPSPPESSACSSRA